MSSVEQPPAPASSRPLSVVDTAACPADPHCTSPEDQKKRPPCGPAWQLRSEGDQGLQRRVNWHLRLSRLVLEQHLGRQLSQTGIALAAQRQIIKQLPAALLQAGYAGQRSHRRAPHGPLGRRGAGQGPVHNWDAERSAANVRTSGLVSPLRRPPTMKRAGAEPVQELVDTSLPRCLPPGPKRPTGRWFCSQSEWTQARAMGSFSFTTDSKEDRTLQLPAETPSATPTGPRLLHSHPDLLIGRLAMPPGIQRDSAASGRTAPCFSLDSRRGGPTGSSTPSSSPIPTLIVVRSRSRRRALPIVISMAPPTGNAPTPPPLGGNPEGWPRWTSWTCDPQP